MDYQPVYHLEEVLKITSSLPEKTIVFIDVDDTIFTPKSNAFRTSSPSHTMIDEIKASIARGEGSKEQFKLIISRWRLQRKSMLVDPTWPSVLNDLKNHYPVYALTKMDTGAVGDISSMEEWRYNELKGHKIAFTPSSIDGKTNFTVLTDDINQSYACFYHGIFMTGSLKKSDIIRSLFKDQKNVEAVVVIDDKKEQLDDIGQACADLDISFVPIYFRAVDRVEGKADEAIVSLQKETLLNKAQWLEDDQAEEALRSTHKIS